MLRSLFTGVSGLRTHQIKMDVVGNNIANINTIAFKRGRATFQDMVAQTVRSASAPAGPVGGMNPAQVGLGVMLGSIDKVHTQGAAMTTMVTTDLMIQGDGYFMIAERDPETGQINTDTIRYTRAGNFFFDTEGYLVHRTTGMFVLTITETQVAANPAGNIPASTPFQPEGAPEEVFLNIVRLPIGQLETVAIDAGGNISFVYYGEIRRFTPGQWDFNATPRPELSGAQTDIARVAIAKFNNAEGLERIGQNMFNISANSGPPLVSTPRGEHGQGAILPGALEMSNVDLAEEFSNMIIAQRGHQANSRVIRTSDEMLMELAQIRR